VCTIMSHEGWHRSIALYSCVPLWVTNICTGVLLCTRVYHCESGILTQEYCFVPVCTIMSHECWHRSIALYSCVPLKYHNTVAITPNLGTILRKLHIQYMNGFTFCTVMNLRVP